MIIIIGAGPVGLTVGKEVRSQYLIIEKEKKLGGLCQSYKFEGCTFDCGGHALFTKNPKVEDYILTPMNGNIFTQQRRAFVASYNQLIPYPYQSHLFNLPMDVKLDCLEGLLQCKENLIESPSLMEWLKAKFGIGIFNHFLGPYNRKVWAYPIEKIFPEWAQTRIVKPKIRQIIAGAIENREFKEFDNFIVKYPLHGGFFGFFESLAKANKDYVVQDEVTSIDVLRKIVTLASGKKIRYTQLVSSIPLNQLLKISQNIPNQIKDNGRYLEHNSLYLINLVARRVGLKNIQRLYSADSNIVFHKLVFNGRSSPSTCNDRGWEPIQAEVSFSKYKLIDSNNLIDTFINNLLNLNVLIERSDIENLEVRKISYAYPIIMKNTQKIREELRVFFFNHDIHIGGRFGEWIYINSDSAVERGLAIAKSINTEESRLVVNIEESV